MKKLSLVFAAALIAGAAHAGESDNKAYGYVNVAGGRAHLNADCTGLSSCKTNSSATKLIGGYRFANGLGLEGGYVNFGKFSASDVGLAERLKASALTFGGIYTADFGHGWGLNLRLGMAQVRTKYNGVFGNSTVDASASTTKLYSGLGLQYAVTPSVKLELALDATKASFDDASGNLRLVTFGATFGF